MAEKQQANDAETGDATLTPIIFITGVMANNPHCGNSVATCKTVIETVSSAGLQKHLPPITFTTLYTITILILTFWAFVRL